MTHSPGSWYIRCFMKWLKYFFIGASICILSGIVVVVIVLGAFSRDLPSLDALKNYSPHLVTQVFTDDDQVIAEFSKENRKPLRVEDLPPVVVQAYVSAEDDEFFSHRGISPISILRAAIKDLKAGQKLQGGSTITQQVAKSILLSPEQTLTRKIREMLLAFKIEKAFTKEEIINLYLNHIFLGNQAYGIQAAALSYFGKNAKELSIAEAAILAGLPRAPSRDNPIVNPKAAKQRQIYVLRRMLETGSITHLQFDQAMESPLQIKNRPKGAESPAPYFTEYVRRYLLEKYGEEALYQGGLKVYTTVNLPDQLSAQSSIKSGLIALDKRAGLRRPTLNLKTNSERETFLKNEANKIIEDHFDYKILGLDGTLSLTIDPKDPVPINLGKNYKAVVTGFDKKTKFINIRLANIDGFIQPEDYRWPSEANAEEIYTDKVIRRPFNELRVGDVITVQPKALTSNKNEFFLSQEPLVQGALLSYRVPDGALVAMVGGYDFAVTKSQWNRATQAKRQPGSTFKPFVYAAALESGLTPSTVIVDSPIIYRDNAEQSVVDKVWRPGNFGEKFYGDTPLRSALAYSRNIPTIKLLQHLKVQTVVDFAKKMGINSPLNNDLTLALGSSAVSLEELVAGWGVFANGGNKLPTYFIRRVEDRNGVILEERKAPEDVRILSSETSYLMTSMLKSVVDYGTATSVKALGRPVAGKTGTTNDFKDAWFLGYVPQLITGVWVGFDEDRILGMNETGARAASPIWLDYMKTAVSPLEAKDFEMPEGIVQIQIDADTGDIPTMQTKRRIKEFFADGTGPGQIPKAPTTTGPDGLPLSKPSFSDPTQLVANKTRVITGNARVGSEGTDSMGNPNSLGTEGAEVEDATESIQREDL